MPSHPRIGFQGRIRCDGRIAGFIHIIRFQHQGHLFGDFAVRINPLANRFADGFPGKPPLVGSPNARFACSGPYEPYQLTPNRGCGVSATNHSIVFPDYCRRHCPTH